MMIRDRGKLKWQSAFFMPDHVAMLKRQHIEDQKISKTILAEHKFEEMVKAICKAMEYALTVKIMLWKEGFFTERIGLIHRLDEINKILYIEEKDGAFVKIAFDTIVEIEVV
jgi:hypothetical protein